MEDGHEYSLQVPIQDRDCRAGAKFQWPLSARNGPVRPGREGAQENSGNWVPTTRSKSKRKASYPNTSKRKISLPMNSITMEDTRLASPKRTPVSTVIITLLAIALIGVAAIAWSKLDSRNKQI